MNILGLNAFHGDSSACLYSDGQLIAAAEEERYRRIKHWAGFPSLAIEFCLNEGKLGLADVDVIAINTDPQAARLKKIKYLLSGAASWGLVKEKLTIREKRKGIREYLHDQFPDQVFSGQVEFVEHHLAHLASAYNVSPFSEASVVSVDGFGDFASTAWAVGRGNQVDIQNRIYFPHSLGIFYQALTQFLGFPNYGDEYKVMGLAPYGEPVYQSEMDEILMPKEGGEFELNLNYFKHHKETIGYEWENGSPKISQLFSSKISEILGPPRDPSAELTQHHHNIARSIQDAYERRFFELLENVYRQQSNDNLAIAGGCGMNSVANGKIHTRTPFKNVYVQSAAGDAGGAIGAAIIAGQRHGVNETKPMTHAYWGASFQDSEFKSLLEENHIALKNQGCTLSNDLQDDDLINKVSDHIIAGHVVGWFQGAMEWGPRALGNRSILGDPRRADMKDILNLKIKRRESFRPFAPSVMREHVAQWFESDADVPFMMKVFPIRKNKQREIPAVTHIDGSGRLQTVTRDNNERYYRLIECFYEKTGVPMLLNTSFNENEPVVCHPKEALDCFLRTKMDVLVLGSQIVVRKSANGS